MFSIEFLHMVREHEMGTVIPHFAPGARILELGGGSGFQAKRLAERGFHVVSVDVGTSNYKEQRVFPVLEYDGKALPFADASFDIVFSSNVLEHIRDPWPVYREIARVLKPGGYGVHAMPTAVWRWWSTVSHYVELLQRWAMAARGAVPRGLGRAELGRMYGGLLAMARLARDYAFVHRHGETGNVWTELWIFSRCRWLRHFREHGLIVLEVRPMGLFYTGHMVLGKRWSLESRARAARVLGSACMLYKVRGGT